MNFLDIILLALRNLRQAKLRTALTTIGVVVGVAAIVTMVSFGLGLQRNILGQAMSKLDIFTSITVRGANVDALLELSEGRTAIDDPQNGDDQKEDEEHNGEGNGEGNKEGSKNEGENSQPRIARRVLNEDTLVEIRKIEGVKYAIPAVGFAGFVRFNDRVRRMFIGGAPAQASDIPRFKKFLAGNGFSSDDAYETIVDEDFLVGFSAKWYRDRREGRRRNEGPWRPNPTKTEAERAQDAAHFIGQEVIILTPRSTDPAPNSVFGIPLIDPSSLNENEAEMGADQEYEQYKFRIVGVLPSEGGFKITPFDNARFVIPIELAKRFSDSNRDPLELLGESLAGDSGFYIAEVKVDNPTYVKPVMEKLQKMGFRTFSVTTQMEEINRIFLIVNASLGLIGGIALLVASFGISNTMIMSIRERTREIGIMKAIGGSDGEIMRIFFVEASLIGVSGGVLGVVAGWGIDRVANVAANKWIIKNSIYIDFFSLPWYLIAGAILFALVVSLIAAIYPAFRAAKVDPIRALRYE
ncbi:MAG: ABC transporter permease [Acidobacteria bacterium]|nr:ABC transporter permease [Acidobacteriota bacterium]